MRLNIAVVTVLALSLIQVGCATRQPTSTAPSASSAANSVKVVTAKNNRYTLIQTTDKGKFVEHVEQPASFVAMSPSISNSGNFRGVDRMAAKTSVVDANLETFCCLFELLASLPLDTDMRHHDPAISRSRDSARVTEEDRNVSVNAFIYAAKHEEDNDYHVIIGTNPSAVTVAYMNVEISGLPPSGPDRQTLQSARQEFLAFFGDHPPGSHGYQKIEPPLPVHVTGSLFYDIDHAPGKVGPSGTRPKTAWEIHPVTDIQFEP